MNDTLIIDIWDAFKEYIPEKSRGTAAEQFIEVLLNNDVSSDLLESLLGYDPNLDSAIGVVLEHNKDDEDEEDDWDYVEDEDEDY